MQFNKVSSAALAAAAAMLLTSGLVGVTVAADAATRQVHGSEFLQGHLGVQVREEQL